MNVIVKKHYPVEKLPEDLRPELPVGSEVTVTVVGEALAKPLSRDDAIALMRRMQKENVGRGVSTDEAVARVRELRDEWDD